MTESSFSRSKIQIIDDEPIILKNMAVYLEDSGFSVIQSLNGRTGLEDFESQKPDLVLLDLRMPGMDGLEVLSQLKKRSPDTPVIVISGEGGMGDAVSALRLGAYDFITKPILDMAILEHSVKEALEKLQLVFENKKHRKYLELEIEKRTLDLKESQKRLSEIIDRFQGFIYIVSKDYTFDFLNKKMISSYGLAAKSKFCYEVIFGIKEPCRWCPMNEVLKKETIKYEQFNPQHLKWYDMTCFKVSSPDSEENSFQFIATDITKRKEKEEKIKGSEKKLKKENRRLKSTLKKASGLGMIVGKSQVMRRVFEEILKAAESDANVIIYGDSGTGKELVAKTIHELSVRGEGPFVTVNCGAIPDNLIESEFFGYKKGSFTGADTDKLGYLAAGNHGTLFMDEIGELGKIMQVKLLRAMEGGQYTPIGSSASKKADIRIIAATNRDLEKELSKGNFRKDFFYRIHIIPIYMPALKERKKDLPLLIHHFVQMFSDDKTIRMIPDHIVEKMVAYDWPGNVRELQNAVQQYLTLQKMEFLDIGQEEKNMVKELDLFSNNNTSKSTLNNRLQQIEKEIIRQYLEKNKWHKSKTAQDLGIDRRSLFRKIKSLGL
ncbi:MAG: sigma-54-dependent Fis family transcriptional regulator, partial [Desulfobacteraceae bacterium]|nr:sigma-54-dependent Fis family transcriptional regulator [Desulfobacteraceae bacterium]